MFHCTKENLIALKCIDNKPVHVISSIMISEISNAERRVKGQKDKVRVDCPVLVKLYNKHMGGVDINDRMKSTHEQDRRGAILSSIGLRYAGPTHGKLKNRVQYIKHREAVDG